MHLKYLYGPVSSFRLGVSVGIDILSQEEKICTYDCIYCQLGKTKDYTQERKVYVKENKVVEELKKIPRIHIDYITFSGSGEPTLAENIGNYIREVKKLNIAKIAVITNSSLIKNTKKELIFADLVSLKLDAYSQESFEKINRPAPGIKLDDILEGIFEFKKLYKGILAIQIMFIQENIGFIDEIKRLVFEIKPDCIQINTPIRKSPTRPLPRDIIIAVKEKFFPISCVCVYDKRPDTVCFNKKGTVKRRGLTL